MKIYLGTGGLFFNKIRDYSRIFNALELNLTYYKSINLNFLRKLKENVHEDFLFSIKANRLIISNFFQGNLAKKIFQENLKYCEILNSPFILIQLNKGTDLNNRRWGIIESFLKKEIKNKEINIVMEIRGKISNKAIEGMKSMNIIHCIDISYNEEPVNEHGIFYTRIFGKSDEKYKPGCLDDKAVKNIVRILGNKVKRNKVVIAIGHGLKGIMDMKRIKFVLETGKLPEYQEPWGKRALKAILSTVKFPITKEKLIKKYGWLTYVNSKGRIVYLSEILSKIPNRTYYNLLEILNYINES